MNIQRVESAVKRYSESNAQQASVLDFFGTIWKAQEEIANSLPVAVTTVASSAATEALATNQPLFMLSAPPIALDVYTGAVERIVSVVVAGAGLGDDASAALADADFAHALDDDLLSRALSDVDSFSAAVAEKLGASPNGPLTPVTVDYVLSAALTPFLEGPSAAILSSLGDIDWHTWNSGDCPVCGTPASNSRVVDEGELQGGRRVLSCPLCRAEWDYQRIRCARCGNRSHDDLHYFYDERDPGHRIHVCEACHGYIKVSVERELDVTVVPQVEDVVTLALDDLAGSKGYSALGDQAAE